MCKLSLFDSQYQGYFELLAHLVERKPFKFNVVGSSPTLFKLILEHFLQINFDVLVQLVVIVNIIFLIIWACSSVG